jgi:hypothetical protein
MRSQASKSRDRTPRAKAVVDAPAEAEHNYYGAMIRDAKMGPRRELTLQLETWPKGKPTFGGGDLFTLRFGAIVNYEEVQRFFAKVPIDGLHFLREPSESSAHRRVIEMEFDRTGDRIKIIAGKVSEPTRIKIS